MPDVFRQKQTRPSQPHGSPDVGLSDREPESLPADTQGDAPFEDIEPQHSRNQRNAPVEPDERESGKVECHRLSRVGLKFHLQRRSGP